MTVLKCKMCGGNLEIEEGSPVCECEYCGTKQTVPKLEDDKKAKLFERANRLRFNCEFDKAAGIYENIVFEYPDEAEGYWGLLLCKYGIEYVDDPATGKKIPTCHRSSYESIMDDEDFELVMENSESSSRSLYREEAKCIEEIRKGILEVSGKEAPYDIFICYKETDENGERTLDSVLAQDVYEKLTERGYRVFFSRISLEDKLGIEYEPYIFAALNSAKLMLAFGTMYEYYNAVWVKNEWGRFLKLMTKDKSKHLIPCFKDLDAYDMPKEFNRFQSQDMGKIGAIQDLIRGIDKLLRPEKKYETEGSLDNNTFNPNLSTVSAYVKRGFMALEDNEWSNAVDFFEQALNTDAENGKAYLGELFAEYKVKDIDALAQKICDDKTSVAYSMLGEKKLVDSEIKSLSSKTEHFSSAFIDKYEYDRLCSTPVYFYSHKSIFQDFIEQNKNCFVLEDNKLFQKAQKYADEQTSKQITTLIEKVNEALDKKLQDEILPNDLKAIEIITSSKENFILDMEAELDRADKQISEVYAEINKRELDGWHRAKEKYALEKRSIEEEIKKLEIQLMSEDKPLRFSFKARSIKQQIIDLKDKLTQLQIPPEPKKLDQNGDLREIRNTPEFQIYTNRIKCNVEHIKQKYSSILFNYDKVAKIEK